MMQMQIEVQREEDTSSLEEFLMSREIGYKKTSEKRVLVYRSGYTACKWLQDKGICYKQL